MMKYSGLYLVLNYTVRKIEHTIKKEFLPAILNINPTYPSNLLPLPKLNPVDSNISNINIFGL